MRVYFFPEYSGTIYRNPDTISFNETVLGLEGLLGLIDLHGGKVRKVRSPMERLFSYKKAVEEYLGENPDSPFSSSFEVDPYGTAERLLSWRDTLISYGWKGSEEKQPSRLFENLSGIEKHAVPYSLWERIRETTDDISKGALLPENLEIIIPFPYSYFRPVTGNLLSALEERGVKITVRDSVQREENSDLSRVSAFLSGKSDGLEIRGDGSFEILSFPSAEDAYRYIASEVRDEGVCIESRPDILDNWFRVMGRAASGSTVSGLSEVSGLPVLGLRLLGNPMNPEYLLSWLTSPSGPIPMSFGSKLADTVSSCGGYFNKECRKVIEEYLSSDDPDSDEEERKRSRAYREHIVDAFLPKEEYYSYGDRIRTCDAVAFVSSLLDYSQSHMDKQGFATIAAELKAVLSLLQEEERELIPFTDIEALISVLSEPVSLKQYGRERGAVNVVSSPSSLVSFPSSILWNGLNDISASSFSSSFLRPVEKSFMSSFRDYWSEEKEQEYRILSALIPFRYAKECMKIVCISSTPSISDSLENPFLIRIFEKVGENSFMKAVRNPFISSEKTRAAELFSNSLEGNAYVTFSQKDNIPWPDHESATSIDKLIRHPLDYFMSSVLGLNPVGVAKMNNPTSIQGVVAHRVIERIFGKNDDGESGTPDYIEKVINEKLDLIIAESIREKGSILLMDRYSTQTNTFILDLKSCMHKLHSIIRKNNLKVVATEHGFRNVDADFSDGTTIKGSIDMVLENEKGELYIFDFKTSQSFSYYRETIEQNLSIQLELYREALRKTTGKKVVLVAYILLPSLSVFTSGKLIGCRSGIELVPDRACSSLMDEIRNSCSFRKDEIRSGKIEVGDGHTVSELAYGSAEEDLVPPATGDDGTIKGNRFSDYGCFKR
ncbi:MAG: PD-(D/E)XK nuclease family protein [Bullifex sp.]